MDKEPTLEERIAKLEARKPTKWELFWMYYPAALATVCLGACFCLLWKIDHAYTTAQTEFFDHYRAELMRVADIVEKLWDIWGK